MEKQNENSGLSNSVEETNLLETMPTRKGKWDLLNS